MKQEGDIGVFELGDAGDAGGSNNLGGDAGATGGLTAGDKGGLTEGHLTGDMWCE